MKPSEMTNEELANLIEEGCGTSLTGCAVREAAARLRRVSHKRKIAELQRRLKVAEDALEKIFNKVFVDCEVAEIANNALAAIRAEGGNDAH